MKSDDLQRAVLGDDFEKLSPEEKRKVVLVLGRCFGKTLIHKKIMDRLAGHDGEEVYKRQIYGEFIELKDRGDQ